MPPVLSKPLGQRSLFEVGLKRNVDAAQNVINNSINKSTELQALQKAREDAEAAIAAGAPLTAEQRKAARQADKAADQRQQRWLRYKGAVNPLTCFSRVTGKAQPQPQRQQHRFRNRVLLHLMMRARIRCHPLRGGLMMGQFLESLMAIVMMMCH
jgi:hypothetical protein